MDWFQIVTEQSDDVGNIVVNIDLSSIVNCLISLGIIVFFLYRIFKKKKEVEKDIEGYFDGRIDDKLTSVIKSIDKAHKRIDALDKLELPVQLAKIQTTLALLSDNMKEGFSRIEKRLNK